MHEVTHGTWYNNAIYHCIKGGTYIPSDFANAMAGHN
jgi:hypothetical protein